MPSSKYIIPQSFRSCTTLCVADWKIDLTIHSAPKGGNWYATNQLENATQTTKCPQWLIDNAIAVSNMEMGNTKSGKQYEQGKNDVPLFCAVKWSDKTGGRSIKKVSEVSAMVFDFDEVTDEDMADTLEAFEGMCHIAYSSYSNKADYKKGLNAFRVLVALDRPIEPQEYADKHRRGFWYAMETVFPNLDQATKDPCRFWFMPSHRIDREDKAWTVVKDGAVLNVDAIVEAGDNLAPEVTTLVATTPPTPPTPPTVPPTPTATATGGEPAAPTRYVRTTVRDDYSITCHDLQRRPMSWVINNWDNLPKQGNGNYNCCRPNSTTIGSAFIQRNLHPMHRIAMYRCTSVPNRTHHDCDTTDNGLRLTFGQRGFRPSMTIPNAMIMLEMMDLDLFEDARTGYQYFNGVLFADSHYSTVQALFNQHYRLDMPRATVITAIENYCEANTIDTLKVYLDDLKWDGVPRVDNLFIKYLRAADTEMNAIYARKWCISAVARAMDWGCKVDTMVIFKDRQGVGKSTFFKTIAGECPLTGNSFFSDEPIEVRGVDGLTKLRLAWIHEWAELSGMSRTEVSDVKQFITKQVDRYRRKYARKEVVVPRHCVLAGTVNDDEIFKDDTGSRRFWAVECFGTENEQSYNPEDLAAERDQLWAEAVVLYKANEVWWLTPEEQEDSSRTNSKFESVDVHQVMLEEWLFENPNRTFNLAFMIESIYTEIYEDSNGEERKRSKAIKPKTYMNWYSTQLKSLGCKMLNDGKKCRVNGKLSRWYQAPALSSDDATTVDSGNGLQREIKFNTDMTVKAVREFGQEWVAYEDMSDTVQADWWRRYPPERQAPIQAGMNLVPDEQDPVELMYGQVLNMPNRRFRK